MKKSGLFDKNGKEFVEGSKVKMVEWDTLPNGEKVILTVKWNQKEAGFYSYFENNILVSTMSTLVRDGIIIN